MHDARAVSRSEALENLHRDVEGDVSPEGCLPVEAFVEGLTFEELHRQEYVALGGASGVEDLDDVGAPAEGPGLGFGEESIDHRRRLKVPAVQYLQGHGAPGLGVHRPEDRAKPALPELGFDAILADGVAGAGHSDIVPMIDSRAAAEHDGARPMKIEDKTTLNQELLADGDSAIGEAQAVVVVYHRDGVKVVTLESGVPIVIGRAHPAEVVIPDLGLSRRHARFTWGSDGIFVDDLESTNGTKVRGERVQRARLVPGDRVQLGRAVTATVNVQAGHSQLQGIDSSEAFQRHLEEELTRSRSFRRSCAVLMIRAVSLDEGHVSRWIPRIRSELRDVDRVTFYGQMSALVLLPEMQGSEASFVAKKLVGTERLGEPPLVVGVAAFPERASAGELLDWARQSARKATLDSRVHMATAEDDAAARRDRSVVIASARMREVYDIVRKVASSTIPVLIQGETGTGKEVVATAIHNASSRRSGPVRAINCGAIPATLIESVLFGHVKGAFTGADRATPGIFEQADGGTVLLDEVGELSQGAQAALLRVLETKRVTRVGGTTEIEVDVRVVAATHQDLHAMTETGAFRLDLLYRINTMQIVVPPLRERQEEIEPFAELFLAEANKACGTNVSVIEVDARRLLREYAWPGNVRELRNVIERAVIVSQDDVITAEDLGGRISSVPEPPTSPTNIPPAMDDGTGDVAFKERIRDYETQLILDALRRADGNQTAAAKILQMPLRTLVHKIKSYGIKKMYDA